MDRLPPPLSTYVQSARVKHIPRGQIVIYEGDLLSEVFIVKTGVVKLYDIDAQGNEKILHIVSAGAVIPFAFFSGDNAPTNWFYSALTDCDLYVVPRLELERAMSADNALSTTLIHGFSRDVHELLVRLSSLGKTKSHDKLIAVLKFLVTCHALERRSGWWRVRFAVNHQLLADMVGITRESAAIVMKELQDKKVIRNPRLTILEIDKRKLLDE